MRKAHGATVQQARKEVERLALQLREAMLETAVALEARHAQKASAVKEEMKRWEGWAKAGHIANQDES